MIIERLSAGGEAGERETARKHISGKYIKRASDHIRGVISEVSAREGTRRRPWYASAIARWTASTSDS